MLSHFWLFWVLDGRRGSRMGDLSLLLHEWLTEAGVMTSLAISFLVRQSGRAGGISWGHGLSPQPSAGMDNLTLPKATFCLESAGSDLSSAGPLGPPQQPKPLSFQSSSHGNLAFRGEESLYRGVQASNHSFPYQGFSPRGKQGKRVIIQENHRSEKAWLRSRISQWG